MRLTCLFIFISTLAFGQKQMFAEQPLFTSEQSPYTCYRIPAVVKASNGDLLAFAEGRVKGCNDFGDVDIVMRRSTDQGLTWEAEQVVAEAGALQAGNPAPLVDLLDPAFPEGRVFLFYNTGIVNEHETREGKGLREVFYKTSADHGVTWSAAVNITAAVHRPNRPDLNPAYHFEEDWRSYANTPGHALQLTHGPNKGRLFIPANHSEGEPQSEFNDYRAHAFYSDDHGLTWQLSETIKVESSNESIAVQLSNGTVMQNIRQQNGTKRNRLVALSKDGGSTWQQVFFDRQLISPVCQASLLTAKTEEGGAVLLFSNPASTEAREKMTVRMSYDQGNSWPVSRLIRQGESAYSDLVQQSNGLIGLLYEHGNGGGIHYAQFNLNWLRGSNNKVKDIEKWSKEWGYAKGSDFQLADPMVTSSAVFFEDQNTIALSLSYEDVQLRYTLDGSEPTEQSTLYTEPVTIENSGLFKAKAFHPTCSPSNTVVSQYFKIAKKWPVSQITLATEPNEKYPGIGAAGLMDFKKGSLNFREPQWMGFNGNDLELLVAFEEPVPIHKITASVLSDPGSWIFMPSAIEIYVGKNEKELYKIAKKEWESPPEDAPKGMQFMGLDFKEEQTRYLKIVLKSLSAIPDWHPGKGTPGWLFVDEILIN